ncbi:E3 ubiquitin-protein ligase ariadne-1 isoform X1 [Maniola jurtina]|uniref:E3 ubiquitin-protein ligase ariadne-1 isoform X1 n=2 Tax=Aphantopus hyperantus TaxID=2795564 RepID=UPI00156858E1|nr:E3 ubiquitin-protein ligase ariadne-1 isoform X1 [Maniola hyperantus]XP_045775751.1 E3 ubiquitin-protein ligase ariadne-1 isoform X1 [Maniola jurtina]
MDSEDDTKDDVDSGNESSGDDVDFVMDETHSTRERQTELEEYPYEVLSTEEIVQHMVDCIKEVNTVVEIPATTTRILLNHFKWDKEKLMERFYDGDQDQLFAEARVINPFRKPVIQRPKLPRRISSSGTEECEICFTILPTSMMTGLECGHRFCTQCWCEYLTTKIMEEGLGQTIACAAHACDILVDDATVMRLVREPRVKLKYQHIITNSFIECNRLLRWCPSPDCSNAIKVAYVEAAPVTCRCGHSFCYACGENWHDPVRCCLLRKWIKKCDDDSETSNWIAANTKECPKCNVTIEKDGGCNHMVCKNQNCKADFCWVCLGPWEPHGSSWYNCNRYDEDEAKAARDAQERSRAALQRYLFYCNRYMNHMQSLRFESKLYASVKEKMEEMQQHNMSWIEVQFLKKAVDILCQCRQTLMYTYVFAYYLRKNNQSVIFEDNQRDLESATETLSEYLEREITSENLADIKQKVQDKYRYCDSRRKVLLEHVHEGYEKDCWDYTEDALAPSPTRSNKA